MLKCNIEEEEFHLSLTFSKVGKKLSEKFRVHNTILFSTTS